MTLRVEGGPKPCYVKIEPLKHLGDCYVKLTKKTDVIKKRRMSRDEKILLLPKKKATKTESVKTGRVQKKKDKRFQVKITKFFADSSEQNDRASPVDSGFSSRPETPEEDDCEDSDTEVENKIADIKGDFLNSLDDEGVDSDMEDEEEESDWEDNDKEVKWKPKKATKRSQANTPVIIPRTEKSDYEIKRDKAKKETEDLMKALKAQWNTFKIKTAPAPRPSIDRTSRSRPEFTGELRRSGRQTGERVQYTFDDEIPKCRYISVKREFDENARYEQREKPRVSRSDINPNVDILQPEDVTQSMINKIHMSGRKKYCSSTGTSCHQCRQKTTDMKTVCRSGICNGVRGQFCGTCLLNRYGESVKESLLDPEWQCPPCRGICNCSFCLTVPTGILIHIAKSKGFPSVHHYLVDLRSKWDDEGEEASE